MKRTPRVPKVPGFRGWSPVRQPARRRFRRRGLRFQSVQPGRIGLHPLTRWLHRNTCPQPRLAANCARSLTL